MASEQLLILINFGLCTVGGWICVCRMQKMSRSETKLQIRWQYAIWFSLFAASGWSFLFGERVNTVQFVMSVGILLHLVLGGPAWKFGTPQYTRRETV